jgi:FkbM family methyltransferase
MSGVVSALAALTRKANFASLLVRHFGMARALQILGRWKLGRHPFPLVPPRSLSPMLLRPRTSDLPMFCQTFLEEQYRFDLVTPPKTIVDAGANIGTASSYFAQRYPDANIYALEPDPTNYEMLCMNVAHLPRVMPIRAALWSRQGKVRLVTDGRHQSEIEVSEPQMDDDRGQVECLSILDLCEERQLASIDLLKIDVEGAEKQIMEDSASWIERVAVIAIELHESRAPGCSRVFYRATSGFDIEFRCGENVIVARSSADVVAKPALDANPWQPR